MQSNIKIFGPQIYEGLIKLQDLSNTLSGDSSLKSKVFSSGKPVIGTYDFVFEWTSEPTIVELLKLVSLIDSSLTGLKTRYTIITTNEKATTDIDEILKSFPDVAHSFFKFYGPSISKAVEAMNTLTRKIPILLKETLDDHSLTLIGEFDYSIRWVRYPSADEIVSVLKEVDTVLTPSGVWYTVTTKGHMSYRKEEPKEQLRIREARKEAQQDARKITRFT
ncbi:MAG: hypothetical protein JSV04_11895 [Candidatus Heimdallarchaeota archaeon]|nr:MAG: hypothetical protein JSV04_11895 [Candidatus Heimdallarchaeota archaeon]